MIGYCPIEEDPIPPPRPKRVVVPQKKPTTLEDTECNYVVMFFIVGVFTVALMDTLEYILFVFAMFIDVGSYTHLTLPTIYSVQNLLLACIL